MAKPLAATLSMQNKRLECDPGRATTGLSAFHMPTSNNRITRWLEHAPIAVMNAYIVVTAFSAYFCFYAFRKPFTAAIYEGLAFAGTTIQLKTAFVVSQILGYTLAKYLGIKFISESRRSSRMGLLFALVALAELAMLLFAIVPAEWKVVAMLLNGLPLGMVFGLVVRYLEGRRTSDILLAGLACSFIIASGVYKDVGRAVLAGDPIQLFGVALPNPWRPLDEFWMPAATGLLFLPGFMLAVWLLDHVPEPSAKDVAARTEREPMPADRRWQFLRMYWPGIVALVVAYVFLTIFRDYRDNYMVDVLDQLGYSYAQNKTIMTNMELGVAFGVLLTMSFLYLISDNRRGLLAVLMIVAAGFVIIGLATLLHIAGIISGFWWIALIGFGGYMAYVPYNSVLFERLMASTQFVGTAVFAIYLADSAGYTGSVITQLGKDLLATATTRTQFLHSFSLVLSVVGTLCTMASGVYFWRKGASYRRH
jgi:MFS family permease